MVVPAELVAIEYAWTQFDDGDNICQVGVGDVHTGRLMIGGIVKATLDEVRAVIHLISTPVLGCRNTYVIHTVKDVHSVRLLCDWRQTCVWRCLDCGAKKEIIESKTSIFWQTWTGAEWVNNRTVFFCNDSKM